MRTIYLKAKQLLYSVISLKFKDPLQEQNY
jgi:hypothetical protein